MLVGIRNQIRLLAEITFLQCGFAAQRNGFQVGAIIKRRNFNVSDTIWNRDAG